MSTILPNNDNLRLPENEQRQLDLLVQETKIARNRLLQKTREQLEKQVVVEDVDDDEYVKRLERSLKRDKVVVEKVSLERINRSLEDWKKRVGPTFAKATTDIPKVVDRVNRLAKNAGTHKTSLLLHGNMGTGKSWIAYAYINMAIAAGVATAGQIIADTETSVLGRITISGFKKPEMLDDLLNPRNKIFFIDDVGQGFFGDIQKRTEVWFELIDHIYTHQLTLLITTNLGARELEKWVGPRAYDRLMAIVGNDGILEPSKVNRRPSVLEQQEQQYRR